MRKPKDSQKNIITGGVYLADELYKELKDVTIWHVHVVTNFVTFVVLTGATTTSVHYSSQNKQ